MKYGNITNLVKGFDIIVFEVIHLSFRQDMLLFLYLRNCTEGMAIILTTVKRVWKLLYDGLLSKYSLISKVMHFHLGLSL